MGRKIDLVLEYVFDYSRELAALTVLCVILGLYAFGAFTITEYQTEFDGVITDIEHKDNWVWIFDVEDKYQIVVVNGSEEKRVTIWADEFEQNVFGQVAKESKYSVGDNVTLFFSRTQIGFNEPGRENFQDIILNSKE